MDQNGTKINLKNYKKKNLKIIIFREILKNF